MESTLSPSLQKMSQVKIVAELWSQKDIKNLITNYKFREYFDKFNKEWQQVEDQVALKVPQLPSAEPLKKDLLCINRPIGRQILSWCLYHCDESRHSRLPKQFCWTPNGTIDRKRTANIIVKDGDIDVITRYKLSCIYCLENKIRVVWNQIPELQRSSHYINLQYSSMATKKLVQYWTYQLTSERSELYHLIERNNNNSLQRYAFCSAVNDWNVVATEYFFSKLSDEERDMVLTRSARECVGYRWSPLKPKEYFTETFLFLLSHMTEDQQLCELRTNSSYMLSCFLDWPYQTFFMITAERIALSMVDYLFSYIVEAITFKVYYNWTDFDYRQLFHDFWRLRSPTYKLLSLRHYDILFKLLMAEEDEIFKSLFEDADAVNKKELILSGNVQDVCLKLVDKERWRSLELLIEQCAPSKEVMVKLKEGLMKRHLKSDGSEDENQRKRMTLFRLFDHLIAKKSEKRKTKDDGNYMAKKCN